MKCPFCGHGVSQVKDSRLADDSSVVRRRRWCPNCEVRWTTFERMQMCDLTVKKRDGQRVPFDRDELLRSIKEVLLKRPIESARIEELVERIVRRLESVITTEISSKTIGELVMSHLKEVDEVGCILFASVFMNFQRPGDFLTFIANFPAKAAE